MVKPSKPVPFGSNTKRFGKNTGHPNLDPSGLYVQRPKGCDPCLYNPHTIDKIFELNQRIGKRTDPWKYKSELEDWSKHLGYRNQKILQQKKWLNSLLGPAWHYISEPFKYEAACTNVGFGRTPRFKLSKDNHPGPGTYNKSVIYKAPFGPYPIKQMFHRQTPCRFNDTTPKWSLAPNRYRIFDRDSIEEKSNKIVSIRGPYDLFTGPRDGTTIKNHFNTSLKCSATSWPPTFKGCFETYTKSHFGEMNKTNRNQPCRNRNVLIDLSMCIRNPEEPGPADINIDKPKVFKDNMYGFNSANDKPPGYQRIVVWPGVGRYNVKSISCGIVGNGHRHVFKSKQGRTIGAILPEPMNTF